MAHRRCGFVDSRLRRCPPDRASAVPHGQAGENALRFPHLAHRSAAVHKLYSAPTTARIEFDSGKGVTFNRQPALAYSSRDLSKQPGPPHYDPWHYVPVLARKPGALRNGAPFKGWVLPSGLERVRRKLAGSADGDRQMVAILSAVLSDGLAAVETACLAALREGVHPPT